jgi:hypothetical protein
VFGAFPNSARRRAAGVLRKEANMGAEQENVVRSWLARYAADDRQALLSHYADAAV